MTCPCGSELTYDLCCGLLIEKHHPPQSAEALMRSRYSAYFLNNIDYIVKTMRGKPLMGFSKKEVSYNNSSVQWQSLEIIETTENQVEFKACAIDDGERHTVHERSLFKQTKGRWFYIGKA